MKKQELSRFSKAWGYLTLPIPLRKRDVELRQLMTAQNHKLTSQDILNIEYTSGFLESQGAKNQPNFEIEIKPITADKDLGILGKVFLHLVAMAYVHGKSQYVAAADEQPNLEARETAKKNDQKEIFLNRIMFNVASAPLMGHLVSMITGEILKAAFITKSIGAVVFANVAVTLGMLSTTRTAMVSELAQMPIRSLMDVVGHEHIHVLQRDSDIKANFYALSDTLKSSMEQQFPRGKKLRTTDKYISFWTAAYLRKDAEIQARLHTVMAHGVKRWGSLPKTKTQLWAALDESGIGLPAAVKAEMREGLKTDFKAAAFSRKSGLTATFGRVARKILVPEVAEVDSAGKAWINKTAKEAFWREAVPYMYGHLLELYGIEDGRNLMGFKTELDAITARPVNLNGISNQELVTQKFQSALKGLIKKEGCFKDAIDGITELTSQFQLTTNEVQYIAGVLAELTPDKKEDMLALLFPNQKYEFISNPKI